MTKHLTIVIGSLKGGGAERVCVTIANYFAENGFVVNLIVLNLEESVFVNDLSHKVNIVNLRKAHARGAFFAYYQCLLQLNPDRVLVFNHQLAVLLLLIRAILPHKFLLVSRNITKLSASKNIQKSIWHKYVVDNLVKSMFNKVDKVIAQSYGMRKDLIDNYYFNEQKVHVIHNPVSKVIENYLDRNSLNELNKEDYVLCVGRLERVKNFHNAIQAFSKARESHKHLRLKIVGDGSLKNELIDYACELQVSEYVDFEGFCFDTLPYYLNDRAT